MADWTRLKRGWKIGQGTGFAYGVEFWRTKNLPFNDVSAKALLMDPGHPVKGDQHPDPDMAGAVVVDVQVVRGPEGGTAPNNTNLGACTIRVTYSSSVPYSGGPQPFSDFSAEPVSYRIPRVRDDGDVIGPYTRSLRYMTIQRAIARRTDVLQTVGSQEQAQKFNDLIFPNYGKRYKFADADYVLESHRLLWVLTGQIVITYRFWRWAAIQGFKAEPPRWPIVTPGLGTLDEYGDINAVEFYDPAFTIPVLLGKDRYPLGDPLP